MKRLDSKLLVDLVFICMLALYVQGGIDIIPMNADEATYTHMGNDFYHIFIDQNYSEFQYTSPSIKGEAWQIVATDNEFRLLNGTLPNYIYGWVAYSLGYELNEIHDIWDWSLDYEGNLSAGNIPDEQLFLGFRIASTIQLIIAIIILFIICRIIFKQPVAYPATLYFALHPNVLADGRRALAEGTHLIFMMLALLSAIWMIHHRKPKHFILFGLVAGFAVAAKHPNVIVIVLLFLACSSLVLIQWRTKSSKSIMVVNFFRGLFVAGVISLATVFALNPTWWENPLIAIYDVVEARATLITIQRPTFNEFNKELHNTNDRLNAFFKNVFFAEFDSFSYSQFDLESIYKDSIWDGVPIGGSIVGGIITMLLTVFGMINFWRDSSILAEYRWLISIWGIGIILFSFVTIPFFWARYYLPITPFIAIMLAYSIVILASRLNQAIRYKNT